MNFKKLKRKYFKSSEEVISMFLGLVIVVVVISLIFNFFQKRKGSVTIPGTTDVELTRNNEIQENKGNEYIVKKGDNLWKIATLQYNDGYQWVEIAKENNLINPRFLEVGQKLNLPKLENTETAVVSSDKEVVAGSDIIIGTDYKVVENDSLWKIAVRAYGDGYQWVKIWQVNESKLIDPNGLEIGMTLMIPRLE
jgi:nucleoid-associated protein YgaU